MTLKSLPILVILFLFLLPKFVCAQNLPPLLLLTIEEIGKRVKDDPYFGIMLAEDTDISGKSETHGAPFQTTGSTPKKIKTDSQLINTDISAKSMKKAFEKRKKEMSDSFERSKNKMSEQYAQQISKLKKKYKERYDFWNRYVKRYRKDMAGFEKALLNPQEFAEEERLEEEERQREIERKIKEAKRKKQEAIERERKRREAERIRLEKEERERERIKLEKERQKRLERERKKLEVKQKKEEIRKQKEEERRLEEKRKKELERKRKIREAKQKKEELRKRQEEEQRLKVELKLLEEEERRKEAERKRKAEERRKEPPKPKWKWKVVDHSLDLKVKSQSSRPTCSSFASIRAIEIKLAQLGKNKDLSEQYFYWASKPRCQKLPCNSWGSSFGVGIQASKRSSRKDIPTESSCPYQNEDQPNNQTQIPLRNGCHQDGIAKVVEYEYFKSVDELPSFIDQNHPVIGGFTLSPGYYKTKAFLSVADDKKLGQTDSNKGGHAFNIIGYLELPKSLHRDEGKRCYIAANSWGYGWGAGGHSCISEAWLKKHSHGAFFAITAVK